MSQQRGVRRSKQFKHGASNEQRMCFRTAAQAVRLSAHLGRPRRAAARRLQASCCAAHFSFVSVKSTWRCTRGSYLQQPHGASGRLWAWCLAAATACTRLHLCTCQCNCLCTCAPASISAAAGACKLLNWPTAQRLGASSHAPQGAHLTNSSFFGSLRGFLRAT